MCAIRDERLRSFVGREKELERLREWLRNDEGALYVAGPAGIGKTALLHAFVGDLEGVRSSWIDLEQDARSLEAESASDLIILDGLDSASEISDALHIARNQCPEARLLLAGRCEAPDGSYLSVIQLGSLQQEDALRLLRQIGAGDETVNMLLAEWSEGNPLLIETACSVLAGRDLEQYVPGVADALASLNDPAAVASLVVDSLAANGALDQGFPAWLTPGLLSSERALESFTAALVRAGKGMLAAEVLERNLESLADSSTMEERVSAREKLAKQYLVLGRAGAAVKLLEEARIDSFPTTPLSTLSNLGAALQATGKAHNAIEVLEKVASAYERTSGSSSPDLLATLANLATAYRSVGRAADAVRLSEYLLEVSVNMYGISHPETLQARAALAAAYRGTGDLSQAVSLLSATASDAAAVLGADHPFTLSVTGNLASAYRQTGDSERALALLKANLISCERVLGDEHPDTIAARGNLATALEESGEYEAAMQLYESVVVSYTGLLGGWHPDTIAARNNLASLHWSAGEMDIAIAQLESLHQDALNALGNQHLDTLIIENNLGAAYFVDGKYRQAEAIFAHLADVYAASSFPQSDLLLAQHNLATTRMALRRYDEAIALLELVVRERGVLLGESHPDTCASRMRLDEARLAMTEPRSAGVMGVP